MIRRPVSALAAALLALACGACDHAARPAVETDGAAAVAPAAVAPAAAAPAAPAPVAATVPAPAASAAPPAAAAPPPGEIPMTAAAVPTDSTKVPRVSIDETNALREAGRAVIVDVRDKTSYDIGHIPGAIHIPLDAVAQRLGELPRDKPIITYCAWHQEATSARAALTLLQNGFDASALLGGITSWRQANLPVEATP